MPAVHERRLAYTALAGLVAALAAQALLTRQSGAEPYPALVMPAFHGGGRPASADVAVPTLTFEASTRDGRVLTIDPQDLLAGTPPATVVAVMDYLYRDERWDAAATAPAVAHWLPGRAVTLMRDRDTGLAFRTRAWLRARLTARFPNTVFSVIRVRRELRRVGAAAGAPPGVVTTVGTLVLDES